nr:serine-rich adhesin for platelets-like [Pseudochaenichthys georgianus]
MESDDNDDLVNSGDETETDSEVEDRVDGVKTWLSKNKGSTKTLSEEGSLKSTRYAANVDTKEMKEGKEKTIDGNKDAKEVEPNRSVSVMSSLSYRKRSNLKDSIGGTGDESFLFSTLKEQPDAPDQASIRKAKGKSGVPQEDWKKSQEDFDDKSSVISMAYSEATSRARKGLESRWASRSSPEFDKESIVSSVAPSRMSTRRGIVDMGDDNKSTISSVSRSSPRGLHRSSSWKDDRRSSSRLSVARSCGLSEFGLHTAHSDDDDDDGRSVAYTEGGTSSFSPRSLSRSFSNPGQSRSSEANLPDSSEIKSVTHRNYLDPDLEAAINEVLSFKPIKFKRSKLEESSEEEEDKNKGPAGEEGRKKGEDEGRSSSLLRSASGSALDYSNRSSSTMSTSSSRSRKDKKSKVTLSDDSSSDDRHSKKSSRGKKGKKSKKKSKKKQSESEDSSSSSKTSESSSSDSTVSYRSSSSVKRAPKQPSDDDEQEPAGRGTSSKKETKKKQKKMDNLMMKYRYKPDSD